MLPEKEFNEKYKTVFKQLHEESYIDTLSSEDLEKYSKTEILTGKDAITHFFNKFNQDGRNKGKVYDTTKARFINQFKKYVDNKMSEGKEEEVFDRLWKASKNGSFNHLKFLFERIAGKEEENINLNVDQKISFSFKLGDKPKENE